MSFYCENCEERGEDAERLVDILTAENAALRHDLSSAMENHTRDLELVALAQEELSKCQQDAIQLQSRLAEATELLARAEDDLGEWERVYESVPETTRLRLEIMGFRAADSATVTCKHGQPGACALCAIEDREHDEAMAATVQPEAAAK